MNLKKNTLSLGMVAAIGVSALALPTTASAVLSDGSWALTIVPTATQTTYYGGTSFKFGKDGNWQSSFSFGGTPSPSSQGMTDNGSITNGTGSSIGGDGFAGIIDLSVSGGAISVPGESGMSGTVAGDGSMTFDPTGRLGTVGDFPVLIDLAWNIDDAQGNCDTNGCTSTGNTAYQTFSTGAVTGPAGTINGSVLTNAGDLDGDLVDDFTGVLISAGQVGSSWGGFFGAAYYEVWKVNILSGTTASGFNVDTIAGTAGGDFAQYTASAIPVPAAVWLFGSGLLGLVGVARRKNKA